MRVIPQGIPSLEELNLPDVLKEIAMQERRDRILERMATVGRPRRLRHGQQPPAVLLHGLGHRPDERRVEGERVAYERHPRGRRRSAAR